MTGTGVGVETIGVGGGADPASGEGLEVLAGAGAGAEALGAGAGVPLAGEDPLGEPLGALSGLSGDAVLFAARTHGRRAFKSHAQWANPCGRVLQSKAVTDDTPTLLFQPSHMPTQVVAAASRLAADCHTRKAPPSTFYAAKTGPLAVMSVHGCQQSLGCALGRTCKCGTLKRQ